MEQEYLSVKDAATYYGYHQNTIRNILYEMKEEGYKCTIECGRRIRINEKLFTAYLEGKACS